MSLYLPRKSLSEDIMQGCLTNGRYGYSSRERYEFRIGGFSVHYSRKIVFGRELGLSLLKKIVNFVRKFVLKNDRVIYYKKLYVLPRRDGIVFLGIKKRR